MKCLEKIYPEFKDIAERMQEFNTNLLQLEADAGLLSQKQAVGGDGYIEDSINAILIEI